MLFRSRAESFKLDFYNPESIEYMNKAGSDVVDSDESMDLNCSMMCLLVKVV